MRSVAHLTRTATLAAALVFAAACGGDGGGNNTVTPTPTVGVTLAGGTLSVTGGSTATTNVTVSRGGGYTGAVDLTLEGAPTGVTGSFAPASVASGSTASVLTLTAASTVTAGTGNLTVRAKGTGAADATAPIALTVVAAPTPSITLALAPTTVSVAQGGTGTATLNITRNNGFAAAVTVATAGAPAGLTVTPASASVTTSSVVLNVAATSAVAAGTYNVTVTGSGTGIANQTVTLPVTVTAAPAGSYTLAVSPAAVTLAQGGTATSTVNLTRTNNFAGAVGLAVTGAPAGLTVTPAATSLTGNSTALAIAATSAVAAGTYNVTVTGTATGIADQTATLAITVTAAQPAASYTLAVTPTALSIAQGATGQATVNLARTNFTGAVGLAVTGAPAGLTATLGSASTTGNAVTLDVATTAALATGTYPLTITGTATGLTNQTATLTVTVTAAAPAASYALTVTPATVALPAGGGTGAATVNLARTNFTGAVGLAITGAPNGLTATLASASTTGNTVGVTLTSTAALAAGTYPLTITGTATGLTNQTATLTVTVPAAVGGFSIAVSPATISLARTTTTTVNVDITRTGGFTGAVDVDVTNLPAGVTATIANATAVRFSRAPLVPRGPSRVAITGNRAVVTLSASAAANLGNFSLSVTASAPGFPTQTSTSATVTVATAPAPGVGNTVWTFCGTNAAPIWFAVQDGTTGAWQQVVGSGGSFRFDLTQGKGGVAYVSPNGTGFQTTVYYGTAAELSTFGAGQCAAGTTPVVGKTVSGTVAGLGTAGAGGTISAYVGAGGAFATVTAPASTFTLTGVLDGPRDFIASKVTSTVDLQTFAFTSTLNKLIIRRAQNPAANSVLPVFDFGSAEAFDPQPRTLTLTGGSSGESDVVSVSYLTGSSATSFGASVPLFSAFGASPTGARTIYTVPTAKQQPGDLHLISASTSPTNPTGTYGIRSITKFVAASADLTLAYGPQLSAPTVTTLSTAPVRYRVQAPLQTEYRTMYEALWSQGTGASARSVTLFVTAGYAGGGAWDVSMPDLTGVAGYNATWGLQSGVATGSTYVASGYDFNITSNVVVDNGTIYSAIRTNASALSLRAAPSSVIPMALRRAAGMR